MKQIILNKKKGIQGFVLLVDDEDYERINKNNWSVHKNNNTYYAERRDMETGINLKAHRVIMNVTDPAIFIDHKDHDGLNCQKENMRLCTSKENQRNSISHKNTRSKYKGISFHEKSQRWFSRIFINGKLLHLGCYMDEIDAAKAYDKKAIELFGEFANPNFKESCVVSV